MRRAPGAPSGAQPDGLGVGDAVGVGEGDSEPVPLLAASWLALRPSRPRRAAPGGLPPHRGPSEGSARNRPRGSQCALRPMRGLKRDRTASVIVGGHAFVQNLRRGFYDLGTDVRPTARLADAFAELALVI
jgi:hypothetical protein